MARALFLSLPLHGHTNPSLPLVRELVNRGDEVVYYSTDTFAEKIAQTGATYRPYRNEFLSDMTQLPERLEELSWLLMRTTEDLLGREPAFRRERPDYLITDSVAPWGQWLGEALGVPVVTSVSTFAINRRVLAFAVSHGVRPKSPRLVLSKIRHITKAILLGRKLGRRHGVKGPGITGLVFGRSALNIVYTSRLFQPFAETFDARFEFVGPSVPAPAAAVRPVQGESPLVYVSLGTLFNVDPTFFRDCFAAFADMDVRVIMSIGSTVSEASLGRPPANVSVHAFVPQLEVLQGASVFVSHGGMNSVSESLYYGVPLVVIPQMSEQEMVGRRVEQLGAGLYLPKSSVTSAALRASVERILADDRFRQQAAIVRESFIASGGVTRAADAIAAFTRTV